MSQVTFLSIEQIAERYGVNKATIWRWGKDPAFPKSIALSPGCTRWRLADLEAWENAKEEAKPSGKAA
jgi:prophage regulatory protein